MAFKCDVCNEFFSRSNTLKRHYTTPKHTTNQAIYDGEIKVLFEKAKEEWDKEKTKLLKEIEASFYESRENSRLKDKAVEEVERYKIAIAKKDLEERNEEKWKEVVHHHSKLLDEERLKWQQERKLYEKKIQLLIKEKNEAEESAREANSKLNELEN